MRRCHVLVSFVVLVLVGFGSSVHAADWAQFRGPGGNATSDETGLPTTWSSKQNLAWRVELPGLGSSSPIAVGSRIFLTCYSGYAESIENPGDMSKLMRHVVCLDRTTGKTLWKSDVAPSLPESEYAGGSNNTWHGYSSSTPVCDGSHLYVFFGKSGVHCFDLEGNKIWTTKVGDKTNRWGSGASPLLYDDTVIINASVESGSIVALDKKTGTKKWDATGIRGSWNTPNLGKTAEGAQELVVSMPEEILAFDPANGKQLWNCEGIPDQGYVIPSIVSHEDVVYVIGGRKNTAIAVRLGGRGDVTKSHVLWRTAAGSNVSSPVYHDGYLYWVNERQAIANCLDAKNGKIVYQNRLEPRPAGMMYPSVVAADGKLYCPSQHDGVFVLAAKPEFSLLTRNVFEGDDHRMNAGLAIHQGQILLRNDKYLYCIGPSSKTVAVSTE